MRRLQNRARLEETSGAGSSSGVNQTSVCSRAMKEFVWAVCVWFLCVHAARCLLQRWAGLGDHTWNACGLSAPNHEAYRIFRVLLSWNTWLLRVYRHSVSGITLRSLGIDRVCAGCGFFPSRKQHGVPVAPCCVRKFCHSHQRLHS